MKAYYIDFFIKLAINLVALIIVARYLYFKFEKKRDYLFTYININLIVFLLCFLLKNIQLQLGFALGLFAIFGVVRYRTYSISIKEMTYLFVVIGLAVINALASIDNYPIIIISNLLVISVVFLVEKSFNEATLLSLKISYTINETVSLNDTKVIKELLEKKLGLTIKSMTIKSINFDTRLAEINILYI